VRVYGTDFTISAILSASGTYFASLWLPLDRARELYGAQAPYQAMYVQPSPQADTEALRLALQGLPVVQGRYAVFYEDSYTQRNNQATRDIDALAKIAAGLAMLAVVLGVYTATRLSLTERSREIGCLFVLGFSTRSVRLFLLARAQLLVAAAYLAGLAAAWGYETLRGTEHLIILGFTLRFEISPGQALAGFAWMVLLSALGVWLSLRGLASSGVGSLLRGEAV
jgi:ABC-type antimicrobial peptide transport system permease subunit